jgi:polysaccharide export outer membrane protein
MRTCAIEKSDLNECRQTRAAGRTGFAVTVLLGLLLWVGASGCQTNQPAAAMAPSAAPAPAAATTSTNSPSLLLHEGDSVQIKFPGAQEMDTTQTIRADGKITINMAGDIKISGLTTDGAAQAILAAVGDQLKVKEVTITVQSSAVIYYITGSVLRPGKLVSDRPLTPLEAIIESGLDEHRSNLKKVKIIRTDDSGHSVQIILNLQKLLDTQGSVEPFMLKPYDVIYVPEKLSLW